MDAYVADFCQWQRRQLATTALTRPPSDWRTARSQFDWPRFRGIVRQGVEGHVQQTGRWPDFQRPTSFGATGILHSLLLAMPRVNPCDKLNVGRYIPAAFRGTCRPARVFRVWDAGAPLDFTGLPPRRYRLKSNHASGQVAPVVLPCTEDGRAELERLVGTWTAQAFALNSSQWWYWDIPRKVFLEEDLSRADGAPLTDFRFHVFAGKVVLLQLDRGAGSANNPIYDGHLTYLPGALYRPNRGEVPLPRSVQTARDLAAEIGRAFQYLRVDCYLRKDEVILGELTFLPNAGRRTIQSPALEERLCDAWGPGPQAVRLTP